MRLRPSSLSRSLSLAMLAFVLLVPSAGEPAATDAYLEQKVHTSGQEGMSGTQKLWLAADRMRMEDSGSGLVTIVRMDSGKFYIINNQEKVYHEAPIEQVKAMAQMGMAMLGGSGEVKATVTPTDETAVINGWKARKVTVDISGAMKTRMSLWLSKDVSLDMSAWRRMVENLGLQSLIGNAMEQIASLEGYPVKQETSVDMMGTKLDSTTELQVFKPGPIDPALFEPPAGFKREVGIPGMPAAAAK